MLAVFRMNQTMERLQKMKADEYSTFVRVLFGLTSPTPVPKDLESVGTIDWIDPSLNDSQKDAIRFALASREVALIHGPPGVGYNALIISRLLTSDNQTGKTHTLIELILQMLKQNLRVLVCGPSNISVDNIVERLSPHKVPIGRQSGLFPH
jgi:DNA polymerase alpha-associated DNA helicase A